VQVSTAASASEEDGVHNPMVVQVSPVSEVSTKRLFDAEFYGEVTAAAAAAAAAANDQTEGW